MYGIAPLLLELAHLDPIGYPAHNMLPGNPDHTKYISTRHIRLRFASHICYPAILDQSSYPAVTIYFSPPLPGTECYPAILDQVSYPAVVYGLNFTSATRHIRTLPCNAGSHYLPGRHQPDLSQTRYPTYSATRHATLPGKS